MSVVLENIFSQILEMSIIAGYCVLAVLVLRWLLRKAPRRYTYLLWLVVAFRLVCPLTVDSAFSIFNLNLMPESMKAESALPEAGGAESELPNMSPEIGGAESELPIVPPQMDGATNELPNVPPQIGGSESGLPSVPPQMDGTESGLPNVPPQIGGNGAENLQPGESLTDRAETQSGGTWWKELRWQTVGTWIWIVGMIALGAVMLTSWIRLWLRVRTAVKVRTRVYETDAIDSAFVMGIIKPTIYLPVGLNRQEQGWILLHETCHIWRKDYAVKMLATVLTIIYWFNPLVWVAWFVMCRDMEMSCDEMALEGASGEMRKEYSRTLLTVATNKKLNWNVITAFGEISVKSRIKHVLSFKKPAVWMGAMFAMVLVVALVVFGTNGQANEEVKAGETVGEELTTDVDDQKDTSGEANTEETESVEMITEIPNSKELSTAMERMTRELWLKMLSRIDTGSRSCCPSNAGRDEAVRHQLNENYDVEMVLEAFKYIDSAYSVSALYNSETVADFGWGWSDYAWKTDRVGYAYVETEHFDWFYNYSGEPYSGLYQEAYLKAKENSVLQISGTVETESYDAGEVFIRDTAPYYYYLMWGTVLREAGDLWQRFNQDYLGQMVGEIYMASFDVENLTGVYWLCLEGKSPVQLTVVFKNQDGGKFSSQFDLPEEWPEDIPGQAMMKMTFDLTTTAREVERTEDPDAWKENICNAVRNYDETHPWYGDYGVFRESNTDFDGDGVIDRRFLATEEDNYSGTEYLILSTGHIIELGKRWANWYYGAEPLDVEGDGENEIALFTYTMSTGGDVTCIQLMKKINGVWTKMPFVYSNGDVMEESHRIRIPTVREKTSDTHMIVTQPECGATVEMNVYVDQFDHWGFVNGGYGPITKDVYSDTIQIDTDPQTGKAILTVTGNVADKWVMDFVVWEMMYKDGVWIVTDFAEW
ncbi:MAG: hypothetical protein IJA58_06425 [Lachnospiraceae bacterium]|nr:hypothetical protein [Lachnospiraceae bacterium]